MVLTDCADPQVKGAVMMMMIAPRRIAVCSRSMRSILNKVVGLFEVDHGLLCPAPYINSEYSVSYAILHLQSYFPCSFLENNISGPCD